MERVPDEVFLFLRTSRRNAQQMGMVGCGLQLTGSGDYDWPAVTITVNASDERVKTFLTIEGIPFDDIVGKPSYIRLGILQFEEFIVYYESVCEFARIHESLRFIRLGKRCQVPLWELTPQDAFILRMSESEFDTHFIKDPRGPLKFSEISRGISRHDPIMMSRPPGFPDPGRGGWIKSNSIACQEALPQD
jgi:hypothetical protein